MATMEMPELPKWFYGARGEGVILNLLWMDANEAQL